MKPLTIEQLKSLKEGDNVRTKGYQDNFTRELIVDFFAGGGGASIGIELATGRPVDISVKNTAKQSKLHGWGMRYAHLLRRHSFE